MCNHHRVPSLDIRSFFSHSTSSPDGLFTSYPDSSHFAKSFRTDLRTARELGTHGCMHRLGGRVSLVHQLGGRIRHCRHHDNGNNHVDLLPCSHRPMELEQIPFHVGLRSTLCFRAWFLGRKHHQDSSWRMVCPCCRTHLDGADANMAPRTSPCCRTHSSWRTGHC